MDVPTAPCEEAGFGDAFGQDVRVERRQFARGRIAAVSGGGRGREFGRGGAGIRRGGGGAAAGVATGWAGFGAIVGAGVGGGVVVAAVEVSPPL